MMYSLENPFKNIKVRFGYRIRWSWSDNILKPPLPPSPPPPSVFHCRSSQGGTSVLSPLGCSFVFFSLFFEARFIAVVSIVSIGLVYESSIVATGPSMPALLFVCVQFVLFLFIGSFFFFFFW